MRCPYCMVDDTRVVETRLSDEGAVVRRRRECQACGERYTTFERAELQLPRVIKVDGRRENFNEEKLRAGLLRALQKRPVKTEILDTALRRILRSAMSQGEQEIASQKIGAMVMEELRQLDEVAYIRFASVYLRFEDIDAFSHALDRLRSNRQNPGVEPAVLSCHESGQEQPGR
ncbi:MAG TPA: transcriptional repressor NrdR [Gammaproteobacteria bacterium]|nr:transcriptional repressor NrdR [Gammaproteobacteria bacterium]